nr:hypothetical protein [Algoriphagus locisalis]
MKPFLILTFFTLFFSCSTPDKGKSLFDDLVDKETVVINLIDYTLDSIPSEIGRLKKVQSLSIGNQRDTGWVAYPPLLARIEQPPFQQLPDEITELSDLKTLRLVGLDLNRLPDKFERLQKLDTLDLFFNKLTISDELEKLKKLENLTYLDIRGNKVDTADIRALKESNPHLTLRSGLE